MRRIAVATAVAVLIAGASGFALAQASTSWTVTLGHHSIATEVFQADGKFWLPVTTVSTMLGDTVSVDAQRKLLIFEPPASGLPAGVHHMGQNAYIDVSSPTGSEARLRVTVVSAFAERTIKAQNPFNTTTAAPSRTYIILGIHVTDVSDVPANLNTSDMFIQDAAGRRYQSSIDGNDAITDSLDNDFTIEAGQTVNGHEVFEVPTNDAPLLFFYAPFQGPAAEFLLTIKGYA
ncbi:MAG: DUF4352 domain-containing protein [Firmicutes bacterium]|nr:DUF4352 domain-containing protein [Bacillota bacterium]